MRRYQVIWDGVLVTKYSDLVFYCCRIESNMFDLLYMNGLWSEPLALPPIQFFESTRWLKLKGAIKTGCSDLISLKHDATFQIEAFAMNLMIERFLAKLSSVDLVKFENNSSAWKLLIGVNAQILTVRSNISRLIEQLWHLFKTSLRRSLLYRIMVELGCHEPRYDPTPFAVPPVAESPTSRKFCSEVKPPLLRLLQDMHGLLRLFYDD